MLAGGPEAAGPAGTPSSPAAPRRSGHLLWGAGDAGRGCAPGGPTRTSGAGLPGPPKRRLGSEVLPPGPRQPRSPPPSRPSPRPVRAASGGSRGAAGRVGRAEFPRAGGGQARRGAPREARQGTDTHPPRVRSGVRQHRVRASVGDSLRRRDRRSLASSPTCARRGRRGLRRTRPCGGHAAAVLARWFAAEVEVRAGELFPSWEGVFKNASPGSSCNLSPPLQAYLVRSPPVPSVISLTIQLASGLILSGIGKGVGNVIIGNRHSL